VGGCGGSGSGQEQKGQKAALDAALEKSFERSGAPGVVAAVQTPNYKWVRALGVADLASKEPMRANMHMRIASVTKAFTVTLLLQNAAEGRLSLDDRINHYVKGIPNGQQITLRQMAEMRSGIAGYSLHKGFLEDVFAHPERIWTAKELSRLGIEDSPLFAPGAKWDYSNTNTILLGLVLERVNGKPLSELYRERIIKPLHLRGTSFPSLGDSSLPDPHARGYTSLLKPGGKPTDATNWNPSWGWAAGGMISTVPDLLVFGRALGTGDGLLPRKQQAVRLDSLRKTTVPGLKFGLGVEGYRGWVGHSGQIPGFTTHVYYNADLEATVAVAVNGDAFVGDCPPDKPTWRGGPRGGPCQDPAVRITTALVKALGKPFPPPPDVTGT
jgi:D-alanyl-D-alanine carboxypeptidase